MKIATLNIDWGKKHSSMSFIVKIEQALIKNDADILVVTENVASLKLPNYPFSYSTIPLPIDEDYDKFDYGTYLKQETPVRVTIFSKYPSTQHFKVTDAHTSICHQFNTDIGQMTIYGTIIGTQFLRMPYADIELNNCINDCKRISQETNNLCLVGDLNTSFDINEQFHEIRGIKSRAKLLALCKECEFNLTTATDDLKENIDHILLSKNLTFNNIPICTEFVAKGVLSDHRGVQIEIV